MDKDLYPNQVIYFFHYLCVEKMHYVTKDAPYISCSAYYNAVCYSFKKSLFLRPYLKFCIYVYKCNLLYYIFAYYIWM